ncbi:hypothetical protein ABIB82_007658 [Bradyrhizobium sp. i1.8.4]
MLGRDTAWKGSFSCIDLEDEVDLKFASQSQERRLASRLSAGKYLSELNQAAASVRIYKSASRLCFGFTLVHIFFDNETPGHRIARAAAPLPSRNPNAAVLTPTRILRCDKTNPTCGFVTEDLLVFFTLEDFLH